MSVLVVSVNPTLDVTYDVDRLRVGTAHRVGRSPGRAGGKALNVARLLRRLGEDAAVVGLATADLLAALDGDDVAEGDWLEVPGAARRTVAVVDHDSGQVTSFNEPGPPVDDHTWRDLLDRVAHRLESSGPTGHGQPSGPATADLPLGGPGPADRSPVGTARIGGDVQALVLSGSLPPGVPTDGYATLVGLGRDAGVYVALDTSGRALALALGARPHLTKPNTEELAELGYTVGDHLATALGAAGDLRTHGAAAVVVSRGADGLVAMTDDGCWQAMAPAAIGNPTGAGDAVVAALVAGEVAGLSWSERLRRAAALGAAAVHEPVAGSYDPDRYADLLETTCVVPCR